MRFPQFLHDLKYEGEVVAIFGQARLIKTQDLKYELRGGSAHDHTEAKEWISLFMHDVVIGTIRT